jgi:hypothetical protein
MSEVRTCEARGCGTGRIRALSAAGWWRYAELGADLASQSEVDLAVTRYHRASTAGSCPASVIRALVDLPAVPSAQMMLQITALHAAIVR